MKGDYLRWRQKRGFAFAAHAFMYTPASKAELLRVENQLEMCACGTCLVTLYTIMSGSRKVATLYCGLCPMYAVAAG